jgi:hypothetical protein
MRFDVFNFRLESDFLKKIFFGQGSKMKAVIVCNF